MSEQSDIGIYVKCQPSKSKTFTVEPTKGGYWCHFTGHRSAGDLGSVPLNETLKWILEQISLGHITCLLHDGDVVSIRIGKESPRSGTSEEAVAKEVYKELTAFGIVGFLAQCREAGSLAINANGEKHIWERFDENAERRVEHHYALVLSRLLGHIAKKLPSLDTLPILDSAPAHTKEYIAEATRCYLLKLDRACIALCRACLEETLNSILTADMKHELHDTFEPNRRSRRSPNPLVSLIAVCARHGVLRDGAEDDAHYIRIKGNDILHLNLEGDPNAGIAGEVLWKTRKIMALIYGGSKPQP